MEIRQTPEAKAVKEEAAAKTEDTAANLGMTVWQVQIIKLGQFMYTLNPIAQ